MKGKKFLAGILTAVLLLGVLPAGAVEADPYPDVLSTLTAGEKEALFEEFLYPFAGYDLDYRTASDAQVIQLLNEVWYDPDKVFAPLQELFSIRLPNGDVGIPRENLVPFTRQYFGRELDLTGLARDTLPSTEDYDNYCYYYQDALCFHAFFGMGSYPGTILVTPQHLYDLGNGLYAATYEETWWFDIDNEITDQFLYSFVCQENADGSYRLIRGYREGYVPSAAELAAFTQPSSWAQSEVAAAEAAGLVPALSGSPTWQDGATRLQFAQLAVQLTETATG